MSNNSLLLQYLDFPTIAGAQRLAGRKESWETNPAMAPATRAAVMKRLQQGAGEMTDTRSLASPLAVTFVIPSERSQAVADPFKNKILSESSS